MSDLTALEDLLILLVASLVPALIYLSFVRSGERYATEPWGPLLGAFAFGALFSTFVAGLLELVLVSAGTAFSNAYPAPEFTFLNGNSTVGAFFLVLVLAPFVEEGFKAWGVVGRSKLLRWIPDGPVFGAAVGLGFGFLETLLYGLGAFLVGGLEAGLVLIIVRSLSSVLLHGSTTAEFGYGYARSKFGRPGAGSGSYFLLAVVMHGSFNALASLGAILTFAGFGSSLTDLASFLGLILAGVYAFAAIDHVRGVIRRESFPGALGYHPRFTPPPVRRTPPGSVRR